MLTKMAMKPKSGALANISFNTNNPVLADSRVFVGNLRTETVTQEQLHKLFKKFGPITGLSIHKGFGFVQYTNEKNARAAVDGTHGSDLGGQKIGTFKILHYRMFRHPYLTSRKALKCKAIAETKVSSYMYFDIKPKTT